MRSSPERAWLFDVDGVLTNPAIKIVSEDLLDEIIIKLEKGEPVALTTGRSLSWVIERVIEPIERKVTTISLLGNFCAVGEKGGTFLSYDTSGKRSESRDKELSVPQNLAEEIREVVKRKFPETMFFDEPKQTMISIEMKDGIKLSRFQNEQIKLNQILKKILFERKAKNLEIDPTSIATDIQSIKAGKSLAAEKVLEWLKKKNIKPLEFTAFGDSPGDMDLARHIHATGRKVKMVFTGLPEDVGNSAKYPFPVIITSRRYEEGTRQYLHGEK